MPLSPGTTFGPYEIIALLGAGGMGEVYRAHDPRLKREIAIKVLPTTRSGDSTSLERFLREARAASAISHSNICPIYDIGEHHGQPFLSMELLDGATLKERISGHSFPNDQMLEWAVQIVDGLEAAHAKGIIQRDIKPANIFITSRNQAKILDFGLAKHAGALNTTQATATEAEFQTVAGMALGTIHYMSPEQARGEDLDARSDLFSFGVVPMAARKLKLLSRASTASAASTGPPTPKASSHRTMFLENFYGKSRAIWGE